MYKKNTFNNIYNILHLPVFCNIMLMSYLSFSFSIDDSEIIF